MAHQCRCCGKTFRPRNSLQLFCSDTDCQRKRKGIWQKKKLEKDPDYRLNQSDAQKRWRSSHAQYMRDYRRKHPHYVERNRSSQKERRIHNKISEPLLQDGVVKMDSGSGQVIIKSGVYILKSMSVVNMDAIKVQLSVVEQVKKM
jgi:hypothetical protein